MKHNLFDPQEVLTNMKMRSVDTGLQHCIAISKHSNDVLSWGKAISGQCGVRNHEQEFFSTPQLVRGIEGLAKECSAGFNHSAVLTAEGQVFVWGKGMSQIEKPNVRKGTYVQYALHYVEALCLLMTLISLTRCILLSLHFFSMSVVFY